MEKKDGFVHWWVLFFLLCLLAYWIQIHTYFHKDVAIILHTTGLMLQGQSYGHGIFEPNPPLIFYLNAIPLYFSMLTGVNIVYVFRAYVILLIIVSMGYSRYCFNALWSPHRRVVWVMSLTLAYVFLFLPAEAFGQREHFLMILTLPYVCLATLRLEDKEVSSWLALPIGILAGLGFSVKPFFLLPLFLMECWFIRSKKQWFGWWRVESVVALSVISIYGLFVIVAYPDYRQLVLPLWMPYYKGIAGPWYAMLFYPSFIFCCAVLFASFFIRQGNRYKVAKHLLLINLAGYLLVFLIPRVLWYYHLLPALSMTCLYLALVFVELPEDVVSVSHQRLTQGMVGLLAMAIFSQPLWVSFISTRNVIKNFYLERTRPRLIAFLEAHGPNNSYDFFSLVHDASVLEFYSSAHYVGSLPFFGWEYERRLPGYSRASKKAYRTSAIQLITRDLEQKKPAFVLTEGWSAQQRLNQFIDYAHEFSVDAHFRNAWAHYHWVATIDAYQIYERKV